MLVMDNGNFLGGISGGCLEGDALLRAQKAIGSKLPSIVTYDTMQEDGHQIGVGLGCNGIIDVLFVPLDPADDHNPVLLLSTVIDCREPSLVITVGSCPPSIGLLGKSWLFSGEDQFRAVFPVPELFPTIFREVSKAKAAQKSQFAMLHIKDQPISLFIELIRPSIQLVIFGGNYDVLPMVRLARELGWKTTVLTNPAKASKVLFSASDQILHPSGSLKPALDQYSAVILMSHDYNADYINLKFALSSAATYIGLLGPNTRGTKMLSALRDEGYPLTKTDLVKIFSPAGLDIGADTPEEIALSILAELQCHFGGRGGQPLRLKQGSIHQRHSTADRVS